MISLNGFYDLHVHSAPAPFQRIADSAEIALWCAEAGMAGIVIKSHFESTVSKAHHARMHVKPLYPDFEVHSGVALNRGVGGINPGAVELALMQGAKIVWMPTLDATNHARAFGSAGTYGFDAMTVKSSRAAPTFSVTDEDGRLTDNTRAVVQLVKDFDAVLATGHISPEEIITLVDYAQSVDVRRIVVTHPELATPKLNLATIADLAGRGVYMEFCAVNLLPIFLSMSLSEFIEKIDAASPDYSILSSDGGQPFNPQPHECIRVAAQSLFEKGVPEETIMKMCRRNPATLIGCNEG